MLFLYFASAGQSNPFLCPYEESSTLNAAVLLFFNAGDVEDVGAS